MFVALTQQCVPDAAAGTGEGCFGDSEDEAELAAGAETLLTSAIATSGGSSAKSVTKGENDTKERGAGASNALALPRGASFDLRNVVPPTLSSQGVGTQRPRQR